MDTPQIDFDEKLIHEVRKHPLIYDPALEDYKCLRKKQRAWQMISRQLNLNLAQCRKRWKGLRDCYKRCKRLSAAGSPKQKWRYFQPMSFLDKISSKRVWDIPQEHECEVKNAQYKSANKIKEDESTTQTVEDESTVKALDEYFGDEAGSTMEFIATEEYTLPNIDSTLLLEMENKDISFEEKLIEEVRQQTCLYDSYSQDYSNNMVKDRVWVEIAERLSSSDDVCRKIWKTLRSTYQKTKEHVKLGSGAAGYKKRWKYFENMKFLDDYERSGSIIGTMITINKTEDTVDYFDKEVPEERTLNSDYLETPARFSHSLDPLDYSTSSECSTASRRKRKVDSLQSKQKDSTTLLFESLNRNIKDAKLSAKQRLDMESSIASLVYAKLLNYN